MNSRKKREHEDIFVNKKAVLFFTENNIDLCQLPSQLFTFSFFFCSIICIKCVSVEIADVAFPESFYFL